MLTINNRDPLAWNEGMTVQDVLDAMGFTFNMITVTVNQELVLAEDYDTYQVPDNAQVNVFHLFHGG